jgi:hypothetical protein
MHPLTRGVNESIGYARCSLDEQDLTAQRGILLGLGVTEERIISITGSPAPTATAPGSTRRSPPSAPGTPSSSRSWTGSRSVPDARDIGDDLAARGVKLSLSGQVYDPADPMGKMFFNILATFAEFEVDLLRMRTREGMAVARAKGKLRGKQPKLSGRQQRELARMAAAGEYTNADLAEVFTISRATVYRTLQRSPAADKAR